MEIEKQVCSVELAKRLKELGVKQGSHFTWYETPVITPPQHELMDTAEIFHHESPYWKTNKYCAFTVAELGEMLPEYSSCVRYETEWLVMGPKSLPVCHRFAKTEADSRAKMLIYLMENKLITL